MTYYSDETYEIERDGLTYRMRLEVDYDSGYDISWIGEYTDKNDEYVVDRREGFLYGAWEDEPFEPDPQDYATEDAYDEAMVEYDLAYDEWNEKGQRKILADVRATYGWGEYRYFKPFCGGSERPNNSEHGLSVEEWTKYAVQDYERAESLNRGEWCFVGVVVEVDAPSCPCCEHVETLTESVWGIESDSDDSYFEEVRDDLISELQHELEKYHA